MHVCVRVFLCVAMYVFGPQILVDINVREIEKREKFRKVSREEMKNI